MTPILYSASETSFNHNGLGLLIDTTSCLVTENRNGIYELELTYPVGSFLFDEIKGKAIIKAKSNDRYDDQLFRIYFISKPIGGKITVKAEHISYKLKDNFIPSLTYTGSVLATLELMDSSATYRSGFNFNSDITGSYAFSFSKLNFLNAILGDDGTSILSTIGDYDIVRDNFDFSIKVDGGRDNNVLIAYKKNITAFTLEEDDSTIITKIYPYATSNGTEITLTEKYLESPLLNNYPNAIVIPVDFTNYFNTETETINESTLRIKSATYFSDTDCDIPKFNYNIEFIALSKTEEYKNFAMNENIGLNDTVIIRHKTYGIDTKVKVTKTIYNTIAEKYTKIELGQPKDSITAVISTAIKNQTKDKVTQGFLDQAITELSNKITGNDGGYVRLNPPSNPSEILVMDNEDINLASTVWRWNKEGLGVSTTGYNGLFTGLAKDGKLVVNEATANKINANLVKAGTLIATNNSSWINMDDGTFSFGNGLLTWNGTAFTIDYANTSLATALSNKADTSALNGKLNTSDLGTSIGNNASAVQTAINKVSNYFQVTNDGATMGNIASGDYTTVGSGGMKHHIGSLNTDYLYVSYVGQVAFAKGSGYGTVSVTIPTSILTLLNGKTPNIVGVLTEVATSNSFIMSSYIWVQSYNATTGTITFYISLYAYGISVTTTVKDGYSAGNYDATSRVSYDPNYSTINGYITYMLTA